MTEEELQRLYGDEYKPMSAELREELCYDMIDFCSQYCPDRADYVHWDRMLGRVEDEPRKRRKDD